jgi:LacI family transcriptional regulator
MKEISPKIRIKDIAELAGVSEGTVDRVLHQRGDVSEKSMKAVNKVLEEIDYTPNLLARSLASKKQYRFICLFPEPKPANYWHSIENGFNFSASEFSHHNIHIETIYFNQYDLSSFLKISTEVIDKEPDAVFVAPIFREETLSFTNELSKRNIPFSFIDSMIDGADFVTYYGQNSFQSGFIAAKLLLSKLPEKSKVLVVRTQRKGSGSNQTLARINGFMNYIQENNLENNFEIINVEFKNEDENINREILTKLFSQHSDIMAAITFNSKVNRLAMHLVSLNQSHIRLIGYDVLDKNVDFLVQGVVSFLIAQRPEKQAYLSVRDMCRKLIFKQEVSKINYVPIDILMKENIEYYMCFKE